MKDEKYKEFKKDLSALINKHSLENESNTPDFILAAYLVNCLNTYTITKNKVEKWHNLK